jgi:2-keto-3-deoxy-L-rhamnonate aldolase RhmA
VPGIDALFVGRIDLTVSLGCESPDDPAVVAAVDRIVAA